MFSNRPFFRYFSTHHRPTHTFVPGGAPLRYLPPLTIFFGCRILHRTRPQTTHATHVTKPPRSNRQNLARLEIAATPTKQSPEPISNRQFLRHFTPLPWIQLQHEALQLQQPGHSHRKKSAPRSRASLIAAPVPEGRQRLGRSVRAGSTNKEQHPSAGGATRGASIARTSTAAAYPITSPFLITQSAIRNRRNSNKTKTRHDF